MEEGGRTEEARGSRQIKRAGREGEEEEMRRGRKSKSGAGQTSAVAHKG